MDPLKLLSRSTKLSRNGKTKSHNSTPSSGQNAQPQLFPLLDSSTNQNATTRKRKRGQDVPTISDDQPGALDFFSGKSSTKPVLGAARTEQARDIAGSDDGDEEGQDVGAQRSAPVVADLSNEDMRDILKHHKLKVTWLNPTAPQKKDRRKEKTSAKAKPAKPQLFPRPLRTFGELKQCYGIASRLVGNIAEQGYSTPTEVQLGALPLLLESADRFLSHSADVATWVADAVQDIDLLTVAPTGSGKTLAFVIPLLHKIYRARRGDARSEHATSAIVLAPTKELVGQIVNEGRKLAKSTGIRVTQLRKGMQLPLGGSRAELDEAVSEQPVVKADVIVSTPGLLHSMLDDVESPDQTSLPSVCHLVLDEADVLLDPLFREQTLSVWNSLSHPRLRVSLWSATMGSNVEELARSTIDARRKRLSADTRGVMSEAPLIRLVVGLKDSAVPNVDHKLIYAATEQGKLMGLRQLLHPAATSKDASTPLLPPFLVFTQTIERAVALHSELRYDIPPEAGGISRIAVLHSDLSDTARDSVMTRFRKGEIWVLITTDLLSRGVDFRGVNGIVNYDIPTSSAAYIHRAGRTGRAGREGGVAITLYSREDIPYLKHVANVVAMAQKQKGVEGTNGMQQWLLDALPSLSKQDKQKLKKRGIESRTARGKEADPKAARKARISSKSGFVRKEENRRKGAIMGSQRRQQAETASNAGDETDFGGFD